MVDGGVRLDRPVDGVAVRSLVMAAEDGGTVVLLDFPTVEEDDGRS